MPRALPRDAWLADAADRCDRLDEWRQAHPRAAWEEIEQAIDAELAPLRARILGETVLVSDATRADGVSMPCPACGTAMRSAGRRRRRVTSDGDVGIEWGRDYLRCSACGAGLFPPR